MTKIDQQERYSRQQDIIPRDTLLQSKVTVIGTGAIGRQVAIQLAAIGVPGLHLVDFDKVEDGNLAAQGFLEKDLKRHKVEAVADMCRSINSEVEIVDTPSRFRKSLIVEPIIFCCVDSIDTRKFIFETVKDKCQFFVDGRMSGETLRVITASTRFPQSMEYYPSTLFAAAAAHAGSCTAKSTIYCANIAAGRMVARFAMWLRGMPTEHDVILNLLSDEIEIKSV